MTAKHDLPTMTECAVETLIISSEDGYCAALRVDGKIEKRTPWFADRDVAVMFCNLMNEEARRLTRTHGDAKKPADPEGPADGCEAMRGDATRGGA